MQVFGFHVYNLYSFPSILNGNVNKCYESMSSDIFCLLPLQHDSFLICKIWKLSDVVFPFSNFCDPGENTQYLRFPRKKLEVICSLCRVCRIVFTHIGWCHSLLLTALLYCC